MVELKRKEIINILYTKCNYCKLASHKAILDGRAFRVCTKIGDGGEKCRISEDCSSFQEREPMRELYGIKIDNELILLENKDLLDKVMDFFEDVKSFQYIKCFDKFSKFTDYLFEKDRNKLDCWINIDKGEKIE